MKQLLLILTISLASCADVRYNPTLSQELEGHWTRTDNQNWHYVFGPDYISSWQHQFGTTLNHRYFTTVLVGERDLELTDFHTGGKKVWRFTEVDSIVTVADYSIVPTFYFNLKRE